MNKEKSTNNSLKRVLKIKYDYLQYEIINN